jgi:AraC-like DNA-binding protein/quercetin dioxygenase-like cupin family protein
MDFEGIIDAVKRNYKIDPFRDYHAYINHFVRQGMGKPYTYYPDQSLYFDDLFSIVCRVTRDDSPRTIFFGGYRRFALTEMIFPEGVYTPPHRNNFFELLYIAEGEFHKRIGKTEYIFRRGDIVFINRNVRSAEALYREKMAFLSLRIANSFFDKPMSLTNVSGELAAFRRRFFTGSKRRFLFIRFTPRVERPGVPGCLETILREAVAGVPGYERIVSGYAERALNLLPREYEAEFHWARGEEDAFVEIRRYLEEHYREVSVAELRRRFGRGINYYNELFKKRTGLTYTKFLQGIRLNQAAMLLKTTRFPVEEISRQVGYENVRYFYEIFTQKFNMKPNELRNIDALSLS